MFIAWSLMLGNLLASETIGLDQAMERAAEAATAVRAAESDVHAADSRVVQARAASLPVLQAQAGLQVWDRALSFSFAGDPDAAAPDCTGIPAPFDTLCSSLGTPTTIREQVTGSVTVRAVQPLTGLASSIPALRAAESGQDAADAALESARSMARYQAADAWLTALEAESQLAIASSQVSTLEAREQAIGAAVEARAAIRNDLLQVQLALAQARQAVLAVGAMRDAAQGRLGVTLGGDGSPVAPDGAFAHGAEAVVSEAELVARALEERDDLRALRAQRAAAAASALSTSLQRVPQISLLGSYTHQEGQGLGAAQDSGYGGLSLDWTVWAWDRQAAAYRGSKAAVERIDAQLAGAEASVHAEVAARRQAVLTARASWEVAGVAVGQAEQNRALFQSRYEAGAATMLELLDADTQVVRARSAEVSGRIAVRRAEAALEVAVGG